MSNRGALAGLAAIWAAATCILGPLVGSLLFAIHTGPGKSGLAIATQFPFLVFVGALLAGAAGVLPLGAVLWGYFLLARRWPALERNGVTVAAATIPLAVVCYLGAGPVTAPFLGDSPVFWIPLDSLGLLVLVSSAMGLMFARALVPALGPGSPLEPGVALARLWRRPTRRALTVGGWILLATMMTVFVTSEMLLPCDDPTQASCFEDVTARGWPYPFIQRTFLLHAFLYDLLTLTLLHTPLVIWARSRS